MPRARPRPPHVMAAIAAAIAACAVLPACARITPAERLQRANDFIVSQRYEDAKKEFTTLLKELRGDDRQTSRHRRKALYRLGRLHYLFLNQPEQALDAFKQVVAIDPRAPLSFSALAAMGRIYHDALRDMPQAVLAYQTLIAYFPKHRKIDRYHHRLIEAYFKTGNLAQVRAEGMAAVSALPGSPWADDILYLVAEACAMEGDRQGAERILEAIVARYPASEWIAQAHYELAELFEERGDLAGALAHCEAAVPGLGASAVLKRKIEGLKKRVAAED